MLERLSLFAVLLAGVPLFGQVAPDKVLETMKAGEGLQVELFAHEPMLINPTSIDVDHKGRVWVCEAVNYRCKLRNKPLVRKEGDRIQILIDEKGEGKASKAVTFYQGPELYNPLGICIIPNLKAKTLRVLVAQSPDILEFTCKDEAEPKADGPPKKFLTGFGGFDHDHGVHGLNIGPEGKLYFTVGDSGVTGLQSSDGKGKKWMSNNTDVQKGTVWRCDLDGKNLELIAHNFRNNYECCVDSFGEIWLSDNDDDGNQQTRICHVMPGGNYGYGPRGPGQSHWHEEQPGIVHKTLRTGFGSPTGITFYEGTLLPKKYQGDLIHCDAGPREVRYYQRKPKGAGYELDKELMLTSTDNWFRPSAVRVAPDGSVFIADWYDPGVGGHNVVDLTRGRIFRLTPTGHTGYKVPEVKLDTKEGVLAGLGSPCISIRAAANGHFAGAEPLDVAKFASDALAGKLSAVEQARVLWNVFRVVDRLGADERKFMDAVMKVMQAEPALNVLAIRAQELFSGKTAAEFYQPGEVDLRKLTPAALREILVNTRLAVTEDARKMYGDFAKLYDGQDIFYRAALNIACGTDPDRREKILADFEKHFPEWNDKVADLVWELRPKSMLPKLEKLMSDAKLTDKQKGRIVDILAVYDTADAGKTMLALLSSNAADEVKTRALENLKTYLPTKWNTLTKGDELDKVITKLLEGENTRISGLGLIAAIGHQKSTPVVAKLIADGKQPSAVAYAAYSTLGKLGNNEAIQALITALDDGPPTKQHTNMLVKALALPLGRKLDSAGTLALNRLTQIASAKEADADIQRSAVEGLAGSYAGTEWLLSAKEKGQLPEKLVAETGRLLRNSPFQQLRNRAMIAFPAPGKLDPKKLPPISELAKRSGNADKGKALLAKSFAGETQCMKCHMIRGQGGQIGPDLSMIGKKGSRENILESILYPSKAIADQYLSWKIDTEDGQSVVGLLVEETSEKITIRDANGKDYSFPAKGTEKKKQLTSIMPDGLIATLTEDELIDMVEYLLTLKTAALTPDFWHIAGPFPASDDKALDQDFGPEKSAFDPAARFKASEREITWRSLKPEGNGYFDLAKFHGSRAAENSLSYMHRNVDSPVEQEATLLIGTDDGCRVYINGIKVFGHERHDAAAPERDTVKVKLKKGVNTILLKINNGNIPHGFYFSLLSEHEVKLGK